MGGAREGYLAILGVKRVFGPDFWPGLRFFGRYLDFLVGFRVVWSVFTYSSDLGFRSVF